MVKWPGQSRRLLPARVAPRISPCIGEQELHTRPAQRSRRHASNPIESALNQFSRSRRGEKRSGCSSDPPENSEAILL